MAAPTEQQYIRPDEISESIRESAGSPNIYFRDNGIKRKRPVNPVILGAGKFRMLTDTATSDVAYGYAEFDATSAEVSPSRKPRVDDPLRGRIGKFWTKSEDQKRLVYLESELMDKITPPFQIYYDPYKKPPHPVTSTDPGYTPGMLGNCTEQVVVLVAEKKSRVLFEAKDKGAAFENIVNIIRRNSGTKWFEDHTFVMPTPYPKVELDRFNTSASVLYASIKPTYNFYIPNYEQVMRTMKASAVPEQVLPNMYVMLSEMMYEPNPNDKQQQPINPLFKNHITLYDSIRLEDHAAMMLPYNEREKLDIRKKPVGEFYDMWSRQYNTGGSRQQIIDELATKFTNIAVSHSNVGLIKDYNERKELFPMFVDIEFSTDVTTEFAQLLYDTNMSSKFMKDTMAHESNHKRKQWVESTEVVLQAHSDLFEKSDLMAKTAIDVTTKRRRTIDLTAWIKNYEKLGGKLPEDFDASEFDALDSPNAVFLGTYANEMKVGSHPKYDFYKSIMSLIFTGKIRQLIKANMRTYEQIMDGEPAHSETVMYRIEKRAGSTTGPVIQNFYLPNSNEIDILKFVDTQVKYGKQYTYTIYAYQLVYGSRYMYRDWWVKADRAGVVVRHEPSVKMIEVPYYTYTNRVMDSPPVPPNVELVPYRGVSDKMKINLSSNVGQYKLMPEIIETIEKKQTELLRAAQDRLKTEPLRYETDDHATQFEVYRVEEHPKKYKDFAGHRIKLIETDISRMTAQRATSCATVDTLQPNKKYYYTFRAIDNHGHISYPTPIYEVEIVDDNGSVYPLIQIVDFALETPKQASKNMKRVMQIIPTTSQGLLNEEKSDLEDVSSALEVWNSDDLFLGLDNEAVWGKKFKIRLTSKQTGRKFDLNVRFDHKHLKIKPE
jgi:hypothetical protein